MNAQIKAIENTLNTDFVALPDSEWEIHVEGEPSDALIQKLKDWVEEGADTEEDYTDEYVHEEARFTSNDAAIKVLFSHS